MTTDTTNPKRIGRLWLLLALALAFLALIDFGLARWDPVARHIAPFTPDYDAAWWDYNRRIPDQRVPKQIIFGASVAREAFDADLIQEAIGVPTVNMSLTSIQVKDAFPMQLPLKEGDTLILALNAMNFDDRMDRDHTLPWERSYDWSYLLSRRDTLRHLIEHRTEQIFRSLAGKPISAIDRGEARRQYRYTRAEGIRERMKEGQLNRLKFKILDRYNSDGIDHQHENLKALHRLVKHAETEKWRLIVIWMPSAGDFPNRPWDLTRTRAQELVKGVHARWLDWSGLDMPDSEFYDFHHVLEPGRQRLSGQLVYWMKRLNILDGGSRRIPPGGAE